jgi:primosomal protein N' (replication factor Y) (superfamily II helicase)
MGIGIQRIELTLQSFFQKAKIVRIDSDAKKTEKQRLLDELDQADIILGTQMVLTTLHEDIGLIAFLLIDNDLAIPEFDREEKIHTQIIYASRMSVPTIIQTYASESLFIEWLLHGNYKDFLQRTLSERETFLYPPYGSFITLWVHHQSQDMVRDIIHKLVNKIQLIKDPDIFLSYDRDIWEKYAWNWKQKIVLKGKNLEPLISELYTEILRNRQVYIERH